MGPRSEDRGDRLGAVGMPIEAALQWGRDPKIAEITWDRAKQGETKTALQWGRDPKIAEM